MFIRLALMLLGMVLVTLANPVAAESIETNSVRFPNAPSWLKRNRAEKVIERIQTRLEWTIRKIEARFYEGEGEFQKAQSLGPGVMAVANKRDGVIHLGPKVTSENFDTVFGHELVHIILAQKYKEAIPGWVEEGLANHIGKHGQVNYAWLARQPFPDDVRKLSHPFQTTVTSPQYHYQASQALAEMIAKKCDMSTLLQLSVGMKMESYLDTYCEIKDLNLEFKNWVRKKGG